MHRILAALLLTSVSSTVVMAQARPTASEWSAPRYTISTGYAKVRSNAPPSACDCFGANGAYVAAAVAYRPWLRIAAEMTGSHANDIGTLGQNLTLVTYTAGPQLVLPAGRFEVFVQTLFGGAHGSDSYFPSGNTVSTSASSFAYNMGGGVDIALTRHFGVRAIDVEYLRTSLPNATNDHQDHTIFRAGLLIRLGHSAFGDDVERERAYKQMRDLNKQARSSQPAAAPIPAAASAYAAPTSTTLHTAAVETDFDHSVDSAYFDYDSYQLRPDAMTALQKDAAYLKTHPQLHVVVGGYADERGTAEYNLALSEKRAQAARDQLIAGGVSPDQLEVVSYGKEKQTCADNDEACYQKNRRASLENRPQ